MRKLLKTLLNLVAGALVLGQPTNTQRSKIDSCPGACSSSPSPLDWSAYHALDHLSACTKPILLDLSLYNPLNATDKDWTILACQPDDNHASDHLERRLDSPAEYEAVQLPLHLVSWGVSARPTQDTESIQTLLEKIRPWLGRSAPEDQFHILGQFGDAVAGLYIGPRYERSGATDTLVNAALEEIVGSSSSRALTVLQHCGSRGEQTIGLAVSTTGDVHAIQEVLRAWRDGGCPGDYDESRDVSDVSVSAVPSDIAISSLRRRALPPPPPPLLRNRADVTCKTITVEAGNTCGTLAERCGISGDDFMKYNDATSNLCSTLAVGQPVCCTAGGLPDLSPDPYENGTCYTHRVNTGEDCSTLAASHGLKIEDIETFNEDTWGWLGCDNLQASLNICLSSGTPPFPAPIADAICGPMKPGTTMPDDSSPAEWALLNPCPLNACCNLWGWCGINPEFCERKESATGNPGTTLCVSNCGTSVVNDDIPPDQFAKVGYFLASNLKRECLTMNAYSIRTSDYTHIQYAFGNIADDYSVGLMDGEEEQFEYFKRMTAVKRVISFGGWDFSTFPSTYLIFRNGVKEENRETFARNVVDFVNEHGLDGVDFDWEYPGAPDLPDIPPGEEEEGERYLEFLKLVRELLPEGKSLSIAAPASFWYLKAFPIREIGELVDYIVYMTYDLRGQWDYESNDPPIGCPDGNCLRSHINSTETQYALAMITKALVQTRKIMVGVSSYGRAFEMSAPGCTGPTCTFTGNGAAQGRCTKTSGYLANAEINEILAENGNAVHSYDGDSDSDILVYDSNQWAAYMTDETRNRRIDKYAGMNMGGSVEWSIDLQHFIPGIVPSPGIFLPIPDDMDIDEFCAEPDWDEMTEADASSQRNVSAYFDYFFKEVRGGSICMLHHTTFSSLLLD
ncbi:glycoside hydrolase superfamily [Aspergillus pseudoustus]|uniref:chitinase n=1 Tax=Aspergillus pseudoustus TaxID=1810923 RepID=A0ABR4JBG4_9EURO